MVPSLKVLGLIATTVGAVLAITAMVGVWAVESWAAPMLPTLYLASTLFAVFIVLGGVWFVVTQRELASGIGVDGASAEERGLQRLVGLTGSVLLGVLALAAIASWNFDTVRASFVSSRSGPVQLERVLGDSSPLVRLRACEEILKRGLAAQAHRALVAALDGQPAVAAKCLQTGKEQKYKGVDELANDFNTSWTIAMMQSDDAARACEQAPWSPVMADLSGMPAEPGLLHCALEAASNDVRKCCAQTLSSRGKLLDLLGPAQSFRIEESKALFPALVEHSFRPLSLMAAQQQVAATLGTDDEALRQWVVTVGCSNIDPTKPQPEILGGMMPLIEADTCNLTDAEETKYRAPAAWARLCEMVLADTTKRPTQQVVCDGVQQARVEEAIEVARMRLYEAVRSPFMQRDAKFIESGITAAEIMGIEDPDKAREYADLMNDSLFDHTNLTSTTDHTCRRASVQTNVGGPPTVTVSTTSGCNRYASSTTVGQYLAQQEQRKADRGAAINDPFASRQMKAAIDKDSRVAMGIKQARAEFEARSKEGRANAR